MPAIEAVRCRGQSEDTQVRHEFAQRLDGRAVHALLVMGNEMRLVDDDEIARANILWPAIDRVNQSKQDLCVGIALAEAIAVDTDRRVGPNQQELFNILIDQLAIARRDQY